MEKPKHTPGPWRAFRMVHNGTSEPLSPEEVGEYVVASMAKSKELSGTNDFLFVATGEADDGVDICHVGNGPNGPNNAALIVQAPEMADRIATLEAEKNHAESLLEWHASHSEKDWAMVADEEIETVEIAVRVRAARAKAEGK